MTDYEIVLPYRKPPLSLNDRMHWRVKAQLTAEIRQTTCVLVRNRSIGRHNYVTVHLHYQPRDNRRRDTDNLWATVKACCDGVVDAGLVPDDTPEFMAKPEPVIHPRSGSGVGRMWLQLTTKEQE